MSARSLLLGKVLTPHLTLAALAVIAGIAERATLAVRREA